MILIQRTDFRNAVLTYIHILYVWCCLQYSGLEIVLKGELESIKFKHPQPYQGALDVTEYIWTAKM